jgi:hypothetical protein
VIAGCGGGSGTKTVTVAGDASTTTAGTPTTAPASASTPTEAVSKEADKALAEAALLKLSDFPSGWTGKPADDEDEDDGPLACAGLDELRGSVTGEAWSPDFSNDNDEQVAQQVAVFADDEPAREYIEVFSGQELIDCVQDEMKDRAEENFNDDVEIGEVSAAQLRVNDRGDDTAALRVTLDTTSQGIDIPVYIDVTLARVGRTLTLILTAGVFSALDDTERDRLTGIAVKRLSDALDR